MFSLQCDISAIFSVVRYTQPNHVHCSFIIHLNSHFSKFQGQLNEQWTNAIEGSPAFRHLWLKYRCYCLHAGTRFPYCILGIRITIFQAFKRKPRSINGIFPDKKFYFTILLFINITLIRNITECNKINYLIHNKTECLH